MSRIFLSHSSANNAAALALGQWLETQGWSDYFLDIDADRGISAGERWLAAFTGAVDRCEAVIFVLSPAWNNSRFCFSEFLKAKELGKRIFGVKVEPIDLSDLPVQMTSEWQVCDLTDKHDPVSFTVEQAPLVARTVVRFPSAALEVLGRGLQKAGLDPSTFVWPPEGDPGRSPYPGLRALDEADAAVFFGRDAAIVRAIDEMRLMRERAVGQQLFVILGASGAGKSSFLRAGLLPRLRRDTEYFVVLPSLRPERAAISGSQGLLASLRAALAGVGQPLSPAQVRAELTDAGLASLLRRIESQPAAVEPAPGASGRTVIVPIDQGEELFAADGQAEADQLLQHIETLRTQLTGAAGASGVGRLRVLFAITIRSGFLPLLQQHAGLQALSPVLFSLPAMPATEFKAVIEGPARRHTETVKPLLIAPQLTEELVADADGADALPLLALTLEWLYREFTTAQGTRIGHEQYLQLGGVRGVIGMAVKRAFAQPGNAPAIPAQLAEQERLLLQVFPFIATADPDSGEWKRRVTPRQAIRRAAPQADALVARLIGQRLLLADARVMRNDARVLGDDAEPVEVVEVAHEALLRQWDTLERWLRAFSADLAAVEAVRRSANTWQRGERDAALLVHTAHRLEAAEALLADGHLRGRFEPVDAQYIAACRDRDQRAQAEREEQLRQIAEQQGARVLWQKRATWGLSVATAIVLGIAVWTVLQTQSVSRQTSLVLAGAAEIAADQERFVQSVRLATLATRATWLYPADPTARAALARAAGGNALRLLIEHDGPVRSATFSPDGKRVVTASGDKAARIWDAETGKAVGEPMKHDWWVYSANFSPDGKRVVTASFDKTARVWAAETGKAVGEPMKHDGEVRSASFSADGKRVVTASSDKTARIWNAETGKAVGEPLKQDGPVWSASFSTDGKHVVTASSDTTARIWNVETGKAVGEPMKHGLGVMSANFSPDGKRVVTASNDRTARIWDAETGKAVGEPMKHDRKVYSASFSADSKRVVTASDDRTAGVWDTDTGKAVGQPMKHDREVYSARFSTDGKRVVTASFDKTARIWDAETGRAEGEPMKHDGEVYSARFSTDGKRVVTASSDKAARIWNVETGKAAGKPLKHRGWVLSASFSPDGKRVVTASFDKTARFWDADTGKAAGKPLKHRGWVLSASFSPDGKRVVTASSDEAARIWDVETGNAVGEPMKHDGRVWSASFSPNGKRVVTASSDKTARFWDAETGKAVGESLKHDGEVRSANFSPNGKGVVTASSDNAAHIWNVETGKAVREPMKHDGEVGSASFSVDGKRVVTASDDRTARIWNAETGKAVSESLKHDGRVWSASFSPDGKRVVTASEDKTARIWDAETGKAVGEPMKHDSYVVSASFSPDGKRVVTASSDKTARIWDAETGKPVGEPMKHDGEVRSANFSPDGKRVVTASSDTTARVWQDSWSTIASTEVLIAASCGRMTVELRRITADDVDLAKVIAPERIGEDVCAGITVTPAL